MARLILKAGLMALLCVGWLFGAPGGAWAIPDYTITLLPGDAPAATPGQLILFDIIVHANVDFSFDDGFGNAPFTFDGAADVSGVSVDFFDVADFTSDFIGAFSLVAGEDSLSIPFGVLALTGFTTGLDAPFGTHVSLQAKALDRQNQEIVGVASVTVPSLAVSAPATLLLLGAGLLGSFMIGRARRG